MPRAWRLNDFSGYKSLSLDEVPLVRPGNSDVRICVKAFALNWGDMDLMRDRYSFSLPKLPACIGIEACGVVDSVGSDVSAFNVGDLVCTLPYFYYDRGASTESLIIDARYVVAAPKRMSPLEAASIWMQYLTAYYPIAEITPLGTGDFALVTAATSTAGSAMLQIGRARGVTMIGTTRNPQSADYLREMGADVCLIQAQDDLAREIDNITGGRGVDLVFDCVGGGIIESCGPSLAQDARIYFYGLLDGKAPTLPLFDMFHHNVIFQPYSVFHYVADPVLLQRGIDFVTDALARDDICPRIDRIFPMERFIDAWAYLSSTRHSHGKVVIETGL